jgi:hypothetical protein
MKRIASFLLIPAISWCGITEWGTEKGVELLTHLDEVLLDLEADSADLSGLEKGKKIGVSLCLIPFTIPPIYPNINIKVKLKEEDRLFQITAGVNYGEIIALRLVKEAEDVKSARCYAAGIFLTLEKCVKSRLFYFLGAKFIRAEAKFELEEKEELSVLPFRDIREVALFSGLRIGEHWIITSGFMPAEKRIFSKVDFSFRKHWRLSFGIYPEGVFFLHPTLSLRF